MNHPSTPQSHSSHTASSDIHPATQAPAQTPSVDPEIVARVIHASIRYHMPLDLCAALVATER